MINTETPAGVALGRADASFLRVGDVVEVKMTVSAGSGKYSGRPEVGGFDWIRAVVTGGASGIGLPAAQRLAREGATVAVLDRARQGPDDLAYVRADVTDDPAAEWAALEARQPQCRLVSADEVAEAIAYLASPAAGSTTGTWLAVDGGMAGLPLRPRS